MFLVFLGATCDGLLTEYAFFGYLLAASGAALSLCLLQTFASEDGRDAFNVRRCCRRGCCPPLRTLARNAAFLLLCVASLVLFAVKRLWMPQIPWGACLLSFHVPAFGGLCALLLDDIRVHCCKRAPLLPQESTAGHLETLSLTAGSSAFLALLTWQLDSGAPVNFLWLLLPLAPMAFIVAFGAQHISFREQ
jgi:hypothetical protein